MRNLLDELVLIDTYYQYLAKYNWTFSKEGFPIFKKENFLNKWPAHIIPYYHRKTHFIQKPQETVLCFFCRDQDIYPRLDNILRDLPVYKQFMGIIGTDITVTDDMDEEWQKLIMLLNQLYLAILVQNGIKIILNTRSGNKIYKEAFAHIPKGIMCASSTLGCTQEKFPYEYQYLKKFFTCCLVNY